MDSPFDIAADLDTPVSAYLKLAPFGPRFLLESVEGGERLARYSFIGFGDGLDVRLEGGALRAGDERHAVGDGGPALLDALRSALAAAPVPAPAGDGSPFHGGLVGVAGYDMVRRFERLPRPAAHSTAEPEGAWFAPGSVLVFDHLTRRAALLHAGDADEREALRREVIRVLRGPVPERPARGGLAPLSASMDEAEFHDGVERVKGHIADGDVFQLVLSVRFGGATDLDPFSAYRALRLLNPSPYMYFFEFDDTCVVGSSPEALVRLEGRRASLRPIAGTRPRGASPNEDAEFEADLLADPKENAEHVMLVDLARNDLGRVAVPGSIEVRPYRRIERYSHVMHMVSGTEGVLAPGRDMFDLFAAAFPAGTVVGAPKIRAMELIDELEPTPRGLYAGTIGYFGAGGGMDQAITIRTLVFRNGTCAWQAGAGIVADSVPAREYEEIHAKGAALAAALRLAEEGL
ncbi:MAG TPA: chorismate-binding protein [Gemmatimonadota bacterium]|nr:chorismate-binding protein [Gemmatimonadota bacterium]